MKRTRFKDKIRIDPKQKRWLKRNKGKYKTMAGFLDLIINTYKNGDNEKDKIEKRDGNISNCR